MPPGPFTRLTSLRDRKLKAKTDHVNIIYDALESMPLLSDLQSPLNIVGVSETSGAPPGSGTTMGDAWIRAGQIYVWDGAGWTDQGSLQGNTGATGATGAIGPRGHAGEMQWRDIAMWWASGYYMDSRQLIPCGASTLAKTLPPNQIWGQPIMFGIDTYVDAVYVYIETAQSGAVVSTQLGRFDPEARTLEIVYDLGTPIDASTTGAKSATFDPVLVEAGVYLIVNGTATSGVQLQSYTDIYGGLFFLAGTGIGAGHFIALKLDTPYPFSGTYEDFPGSYNSGTLMTTAIRKD